jgi:hypothetical protein
VHAERSALTTLSATTRDLTYEEKSLGRLQTLCDNGTRAVSTYNRTLDRWDTTITESLRKGSVANLIPLANCSTAGGLRDQFLKSRAPRLGEWFLHEPIRHAHNVDGCCRQHMLEMRFRPSNIPSVSSPIGPDALGQRPLNTSASGVLGRIRCGGFSCTCGLQCHVVILPTHGDRPSCRASAVDPIRTGLTVLHGALDLHDFIGTVIHGWRPADAGIPAWARRPLLLPIDLEVARITSLCGLRWPLTIGAHRTEPLHAVLTLAGDQQFGVEVARIDEMRGRQQPLTCERLVDMGCGRTIADGPSGGFHMGHDVRCIVLAGLGHMDCIPHPRRRLLVAVPGLDVIRRTDQQPRRWNTFFVRPPKPAPGLQITLLAPHTASRLDGRHLAPPCRRLGGIHIGQYGLAIGSNDLGIGVTVFFPRGSAVILHAPPIALLPRHLAMRVEPLRGDDGQAVEGIA